MAHQESLYLILIVLSRSNLYGYSFVGDICGLYWRILCKFIKF